LKISDINLKTMFSPMIYRRGLDYYKNNKVSDLIYDKNAQAWMALVHGSEAYFVKIGTGSLSQGTVQAYCDCPAFKSDGSCKHVVCMMLEIADKEGESTFNKSYDYNKTNRFMQALSSVRDNALADEILPKQEPMSVEYHLSWTYDGILLLELKTGVSRRYVVKDIYEFLENVEHGFEHFFTKKFTYNPENHYFLKEDREILDMLTSFKKNETVYNDTFLFEAGRTTKDRRFMIIPPMVAKELLKTLLERNLIVDTGREQFNNISLEQETLPFHFSLAENQQEDLLLKMNDIQADYLPLYEMLFYGGIFYFPNKTQIPIVEQIDQFGMDDVELPIRKSQADQFLSEVLPSLQQIGDVEVSENVKSEVIQAPLEAKLYLQLVDDLVIGNLEYHYGTEQIDPFTGQGQTDSMIIRDVEKEQKIMQLIEHANFHYNGKALYINPDEEEMFDLLYHLLPMLNEYVEVFLTSELRSLIMDTTPEANTHVNLESDSNLLQIGFDIGGVNGSEVQAVLEAVIEKKRYYQLESGALISLEGEGFSSIRQFFDDMDVDKKDLQDGELEMPVYRGAQVDELIDTKKKYNISFQKLLDHLKNPEDQEYMLPENLNADLRDYQKTGFRWFKSLSDYYLGGILADDMGLGKTIQAISYIASEPSERVHLIVAPSSVIYNWKNEFSKFVPDVNVEILTGAPNERHEKINSSQDADVWITSYQTLRQDIDYYREISFHSMILDEAQFIKNYQTKTSQAIRQVRAKHRFALSGTPIENSVDELWSIFQVILPGLMPNQRKFKQLSNKKIHALTSPFILRRLKSDVLKELPDKIETVHYSTLSQEQKELYVGYLQKVRREAAESINDSEFSQNRMKILAGLTRLRQICCHPSMFIENYEGESGKLEQLLETVRSAQENGKRMLIFSQFTSMHEIIIQRLNEEGIDYFYLNGQTSSQDRVKMSERFNNGEKSIFLISLKAGGTGLNLTGADTVILYDLWWNPAIEDQAAGRAHRLGQKNVVQVIRLVAEGTIEEKIYELQQKKRQLIDEVVQPGEKTISSLSEEDVRELLSI